jgi:hypothetical protein
MLGSPAIDAGDPGAVAGVDGVPLHDQRGAPFVRVYGGRIDMGAVEAIPAGLLPGDYNIDGIVDAADYTSWRDQLGWSVTPGTGADGNGDGRVDQQDYEVWVSNFGLRLPVGGGAGETGTHEAMAEPVAPSHGAVTANQPPALPGVKAAEGLVFAAAQAKPPAEPGADGRLRRHPQIQIAARQDRLLEAWRAVRDNRKQSARAEPVALEDGPVAHEEGIATAAVDCALERIADLRLMIDD